MEDRRLERFAADDEVVFTSHDKVGRGYLSNLTVAGCMLRCREFEPEPGDSLSVTLLDGVSAEGKVMWRREGHIGVEFDKHIGEATARYFRMNEGNGTEGEDLRDSFGRQLPPLRKGMTGGNAQDSMD